MCYQARIFIVNGGDASIAHVYNCNSSITRCLLRNSALSRRSLVVPNSVERRRWYFIGLYRIGMKEHLLPCTKNLAHWPGGDVAVSAMDPVEYKEASKKRVNEIQAFLRSSRFVTTLFKGAIPSIPRWRYAREMEKKVAKDADGSESDGESIRVSCPVYLKGVARGRKGFLGASRKIFAGKGELAEHLIHTETQRADPDIPRLAVTRSIHSSESYLAEKISSTHREFVNLVRSHQFLLSVRYVPILVACPTCIISDTRRMDLKLLDVATRIGTHEIPLRWENINVCDIPFFIFVWR